MKTEKQKLLSSSLQENSNTKRLKQKCTLDGTCFSQLSIAVTNDHILNFKGEFLFCLMVLEVLDPWMLGSTAFGMC